MLGDDISKLLSIVFAEKVYIYISIYCQESDPNINPDRARTPLVADSFVLDAQLFHGSRRNEERRVGRGREQCLGQTCGLEACF